MIDDIVMAIIGVSAAVISIAVAAATFKLALHLWGLG